MDYLAKLIESYIDTLLIGALIIIPTILFYYEKNKSHEKSFIERIVILLSSRILLAIVIASSFAVGLMFDAVTYWSFQKSHEKVISHAVCLQKEKKISSCASSELSRTDFYQVPVSFINFEIFSPFLKDYAEHLPNQAEWFLKQKDTFNERLENLDKSLKIAKAILFSCVFISIISFL